MAFTLPFTFHCRLRFRRTGSSLEENRSGQSRAYLSNDFGPTGKLHPFRRAADPRAGWHTYWKTPGDTGLPTTIDWSLPEGWKAGSIQWPTPKLYVVGDLTNFGYEDSILLPVSISVPASAKEGEYVAKANVSWLMCAEQCIPGNASFDLPVKVSNAEPAASPNAGLFQTNDGLTPTPLKTVSAQIDPSNRALSVTFKTSEPFNHFYVFTEGEGAVDYKAPQSVSKNGDEVTVPTSGHGGTESR